MSVDVVEAMLIKVRAWPRASFVKHALRLVFVSSHDALPNPALAKFMQDEKATYLFGDVKGKTRRFCGDELK
eukprot:1133435-Pleurochrysis_carterae.AAC.1